MSSPTMLRDLLSKSQSNPDQSERQESHESTRENFNASTTKPHKDDEEFVPVSHEDVEDVDNEEEESEMERVLRPLLGLGRQGQRSRVAAPNKYDDLHPYTQILSLSNLEACVALERSAFPEHERCSRDKVCLLLLRSTSFFHANLGLPKEAMGHVPTQNVILGSQMSSKITCESGLHRSSLVVIE
jgi:hypothetical protein